MAGPQTHGFVRCAPCVPIEAHKRLTRPYSVGDRAKLVCLGMCRLSTVQRCLTGVDEVFECIRQVHGHPTQLYTSIQAAWVMNLIISGALGPMDMGQAWPLMTATSNISLTAPSMRNHSAHVPLARSMI